MFMPLSRPQLKISAFSGKFNVCSKCVLLSWIKICRDFTLQTQDFYSEIKELTQILLRISGEKIGGWRLWMQFDHNFDNNLKSILAKCLPTTLTALLKTIITAILISWQCVQYSVGNEGNVYLLDNQDKLYNDDNLDNIDNFDKIFKTLLS